MLLFFQDVHPFLEIFMYQLNAVVDVGVQEARDFLLLCVGDGVRLLHLIHELSLQQLALPLHHHVCVLAQVQLLSECILLVFHYSLQVLHLLVELFDQEVLVHVVFFILVLLEAGTAVLGFHFLRNEPIQLLCNGFLLLFYFFLLLLVLQLVLIRLTLLFLFGQLLLQIKYFVILLVKLLFILNDQLSKFLILILVLGEIPVRPVHLNLLHFVVHLEMLELPFHFTSLLLETQFGILQPLVLLGYSFEFLFESLVLIHELGVFEGELVDGSLGHLRIVSLVL